MINKIMEDSKIILDAKKFAQDKHKNQKRENGITTYYEHLEGVVNRLKSLGIIDKNVLSAAWLHDTIEETDVTFDEINERFGREVAIIVLSLSKEKNILKNKEERYINQLKSADLQAKIVKLCDISANLKDLINSPISKTQKNKQVRKMSHYLNVIKNEVLENKSKYPKIQEIIDGINAVCIKYKQKPISI
jgi:(p)ppGpp synthase/HD superfamily hydrolase